MEPVVHHIHIAVCGLERAEPFYDRVLPLLGFDLRNKTYTRLPERDSVIIEYRHRNLSFAIAGPPSPSTGRTRNSERAGRVLRVAFGAGTDAEVDELYERVRDTGAVIVHPPRKHPEDGVGYYGFVFEDPDGNELEIVHCEREGQFPREKGSRFETAEIREVSDSERPAVAGFLKERWSSTRMVVRGRVIEMTLLDGFAAWEGASLVGLVT